MGGFQSRSLNAEFKQGLYNIIIVALIKGCDCMVEDCNANRQAIPNHEEILRTHLLENYLEKDEIRSVIGLSNMPIRFLPEVVENYNPSSNTYTGRTDIRVVSSNWFNNNKDYYIVECKRIDGTASLNQKYVEDGICRFTGETPKYSSYNNRNIMLGFIVKDIDHTTSITAISDIHMAKLKKLISKNITVIEHSESYYLCESTYTNGLSLSHIFHNFSSIVSA